MGTTKSKLKPKELSDLRNTTLFSKQELKEWYKGFREDYPSGYLTIVSFKELYTYFFPDGDATAFATHSFRTFDSNQDGRIDFREFITALSVTTRGTSDEKLEWVFSMYDLDGNGCITRTEMLVIVRSIHKMTGNSSDPQETGLTPELRVEKMYQLMDKDSDGKLTLDEFITGAKSDPKMSAWFQNAQPVV